MLRLGFASFIMSHNAFRWLLASGSGARASRPVPGRRGSVAHHNAQVKLAGLNAAVIY
ncbi:hypothetical protein I546_4438 [Mycobacterium kansasii 732]|nr:hypothetical protein I546_4438 [Mycobacterium kansasii 732]